MDEDDTARRLRRVPFDEMEKQAGEAMKDSGKISPVYSLGGKTVERNTFYNPYFSRHYRLQKALEAGNWTFDEFCEETEKRAIVEQVDAFNESIEFPNEILERAKMFFPNIKFIPARLELE